MLDNVRVCYFLNCVGQAVPSFRPSVEKTVFAKLHLPNCFYLIDCSCGCVCSNVSNMEPTVKPCLDTTVTCCVCGVLLQLALSTANRTDYKAM